MYAVWVDARDLSYHNFECILPLDRALQKEGPLDLKLENFKRLNKVYSISLSPLPLPLSLQFLPSSTLLTSPLTSLSHSSFFLPLFFYNIIFMLIALFQMNVYVGKVTGKDVDLLQKLDDLGLYQKPSNSATRGGERFLLLLFFSFIFLFRLLF
jgi:hypothetical protein